MDESIMAAKRRANSGLVYSTDRGRMCPKCGKPATQCSCAGGGSAPKGDGIVRVAKETKGRKGKGVTVITGIPLGGQELKELATRLKQKCGTGGTVKGGIIEIQGDHRDVLVDLLSEHGWTVRRSGA